MPQPNGIRARDDAVQLQPRIRTVEVVRHSNVDGDAESKHGGEDAVDTELGVTSRSDDVDIEAEPAAAPPVVFSFKSLIIIYGVVISDGESRKQHRDGARTTQLRASPQQGLCPSRP
jgi:hypothetical protein